MTDQHITQETVIKISKLCKLNIDGLEEKLVTGFNETLKYIDILNELDLETLSATYQVTGLTNIFQKSGEPNTTLTTEKALQNAKNTVNNLFVTKGVFDRE